MDYSTWPCSEFERQFFKEVEVGSAKILVPATKLGARQIDRANKARIEKAREILSNESALVALRAAYKKEIAQLVAGVESSLPTATGELLSFLGERLIAFRGAQSLPPDGPATDEDCSYYVSKHKTDDEIHCAWIAALYRPFAGSPAISVLYEFLPLYILVETQNFFSESVSGPTKNSEETPLNSTDESPVPAKAPIP